MTAILSTTYDNQYLFFLPITTWAWNKLGIDVVCFIPDDCGDVVRQRRRRVMRNYFQSQGNNRFAVYNCPKDKEATYAQCSRLYGAALPLFQDDEVLITGDIDMAVFNRGYFNQFNDGYVHVAGADLVPENQYPICFIGMPAKIWREVMNIPLGVSAQEKLDDLLGAIECEHFRGNLWSKDQETIFNALKKSDELVFEHLRAAPGTQFATRRADRDGWPEAIPPGIIDAHMKRPGYTEDNFKSILDLFQTMYPDDNFDWMIDYRNEYVKLL